MSDMSASTHLQLMIFVDITEVLFNCFMEWNRFVDNQQVVGGGMIATIGSSILCMSLPYEAGLNAKHIAWVGKLTNILMWSYAKFGLNVHANCGWFLHIVKQTILATGTCTYWLTEGEIVIIMDKASTKALLYWPHYGNVNSAMPKCLIFINKKWSMLKFNISHKAKWMQAEAKTLYPFKCIYILSFIFFLFAQVKCTKVNSFKKG